MPHARAGGRVSGVETPRKSGNRKNQKPLQWSHALSGVEIASGAIDLRRAVEASMEPRPFRRGNRSPVRVSRIWDSLQWSHALSGVETMLAARQSHRHSGFNGATPSQGSPEYFIGRNLGQRRPQQLTEEFQAWKLAYDLAIQAVEGMLQWSHALSGVETRTR